ncbi:uncharacterized protein LOC141505057 [Macrotis lagotis]|uniref:uncharacterized protein LOC141505057 n=1 Tax=Macrotis lagotis TaxID=92651 RepID=UPI003D69B961
MEQKQAAEVKLSRPARGPPAAAPGPTPPSHSLLSHLPSGLRPFSPRAVAQLPPSLSPVLSDGPRGRPAGQPRAPAAAWPGWAAVPGGRGGLAARGAGAAALPQAVAPGGARPRAGAAAGRGGGRRGEGKCMWDREGGRGGGTRRGRGTRGSGRRWGWWESAPPPPPPSPPPEPAANGSPSRRPPGAASARRPGLARRPAPPRRPPPRGSSESQRGAREGAAREERTQARSGGSRSRRREPPPLRAAAAAAAGGGGAGGGDAGETHLPVPARARRQQRPPLAEPEAAAAGPTRTAAHPRRPPPSRRLGPRSHPRAAASAWAFPRSGGRRCPSARPAPGAEPSSARSRSPARPGPPPPPPPRCVPGVGGRRLCRAVMQWSLQDGLSLIWSFLRLTYAGTSSSISGL